jgi:signal transduction histidine kinase
LQTFATVALSMLALAATLVVARVGMRYRELTIESQTRRREAVRARREIDSLLEATGDGVLGIDLDGKCISLNRAGVALLGYTEREIVARDVHDTLFHSHADGAPAPRGSSPVLGALAAGEPLDSPPGAILWRRRRVSFPSRWSLRPLVDGVELRGSVLTFTDMTEIREKEEALRRAIRQREDVVSIVSHDLRNPLGVALAAADLLLDLPLDEAQRRRQAEIIVRSGRRMQSLIDDLLDLARIEAGALVVRPSLEELVPILEEAREVFEDQAERKGIEIVVSGGDGELEARVDRDRILQALANLLDNAVRFTPEGGRVDLGVADGGDDLEVTVSDTGPGIAPEMVGHLFDRFSQGDGAGRGGAGLGLAIVEGVAIAHGGTVSVESAVGQGARFVLRLPKAGPPVGEHGARADRGPLVPA